MSTKPTIPLLLQGTPVETHADLWRFWLMPGEPEPGVQIRKAIDPTKPISWRELDKLLQLYEIAYRGTDASSSPTSRSAPRSAR